MESIQGSLHHISNSVVWFLFRLCLGIFLLETAYTLLLALTLLPAIASYYHELTIILWVLQTLKFLLLIAWILVLTIPWGTTNYYLTNEQLVRYTGLWRRDEHSYQLALLRNVELHQGWLGRLFVYGDIHLTFASSGYSEKVVLYGIYNPKKYEAVLRQFLTTTTK